MQIYKYNNKLRKLIKVNCRSAFKPGTLFKFKGFRNLTRSIIDKFMILNSK